MVAPSVQKHADSKEARTLPDLAGTESLCADLRRMLLRSESGRDDSAVRTNIETIEQWIELSRHGLGAAPTISKNDVNLLQKAHDELRLSLEEQLRLEDESSNPLLLNNATEAEELIKAIRCLEKLLPKTEHSFHTSPFSSRSFH